MNQEGEDGESMLGRSVSNGKISPAVSILLYSWAQVVKLESYSRLVGSHGSGEESPMLDAI